MQRINTEACLRGQNTGKSDETDFLFAPKSVKYFARLTNKTHRTVTYSILHVYFIFLSLLFSSMTSQVIDFLRSGFREHY